MLLLSMFQDMEHHFRIGILNLSNLKRLIDLSSSLYLIFTALLFCRNILKALKEIN